MKNLFKNNLKKGKNVGQSIKVAGMESLKPGSYVHEKDRLI